MFAGNFSGGAPIGDYGIYRVTRDWVEEEADWNYASEETPWTNPGGDFASETIDVVKDVAKQEGSRWMSYDVLETVKEFIANPDENFGFLLKNDFFSQEVDVASSEFEDTELRPKLTVEYTTMEVTPSQKRPTFMSAGKQVTLTTSNRQLHIMNNGTTPVNLVLSRLNGTVVSTGSLTGGTYKTLSASGAGVYLISVYGNDKAIHKRISLFP